MGSEEQLYLDLLFLCTYLGCLVLASYFCRTIKISPIVGYILVGILLGPQGLDFVPLFIGNTIELTDDETSNVTSSAMWKRSLAAEGEEVTAEVENFLVILGQLGVTFLILESGFQVDFKTLKSVGGPAVMVATLGSIGPISLGICFSKLLGFGFFPQGLAFGAMLAPTSVGIALKLLTEANVLESGFGQTIVTAAFIDDVYSLVVLAVLLAVAKGQLQAFDIIAPFLYCGGFLLGGFLIATYIVPRVIPPFLTWITGRYGQGTRDAMHLFLIFAVLAVYGYIGSLAGSHLLGAFVCGLTFCKVPRSFQLWDSSLHEINEWLLAIFFGATVAFAVPVGELLNVTAFWKGLVVGIVPVILGKLICSITLRKRWIIGWAMVGRGEFAFLVGSIYKETEFGDTGQPFLSDEAFGVAVWGILIAIFVAPIAFGLILASQMKKEAAQAEELAKIKDSPEVKAASSFSRMASGLGNTLKQAPSAFDMLARNQRKAAPRSEWFVNVSTPYQRRLTTDIMRIFSDREIHVKSMVNEGDLEETLLMFIILIPDSSQDSATAGYRVSTANIRSRLSGIQSQVTSEEVPKFKDTFFSFDIDLYVSKLKQEIESVANGQAVVKIERSEASRRPAPSMMGDPVPSRPMASQANPDGEEDDVDSVGAAPRGGSINTSL